MKSMKSRHAKVSVDAMLESLQSTEADKEKHLQEEDEALIKSVFSSESKELIKRVRDEDLVETDDFMKRIRMSYEGLPSKAPEALTKASLDNSGNPKNLQGSRTSGGAKPFHINVVKKAVKPNRQKIEEDSKISTTSRLQSLCQNYDSDED